MCFIVPHLSPPLCVLHLRVTVYNEVVPWHRQITALARAAVCHGGDAGSIVRPQAQGLGWASEPWKSPSAVPSALCPTPGSLVMEAGPSACPYSWPVACAHSHLLHRGTTSSLSHEDLRQSSWVLCQCSRERALPWGAALARCGRRRGSRTGDEPGKSWSQEAGRAGGGVLGGAADLWGGGPGPGCVGAAALAHCS